jgi:hypothetical protein
MNSFNEGEESGRMGNKKKIKYFVGVMKLPVSAMLTLISSVNDCTICLAFTI